MDEGQVDEGQEGVVSRKRRLTKEEILQISNDISEDMCRASAWQLVQVVEFFRDDFEKLWQATMSARLKLGSDLLKVGTELLKPLKLKNTPPLATAPLPAEQVKQAPGETFAKQGHQKLGAGGVTHFFGNLRCMMGKDGRTWNLFEELTDKDCASTNNVCEVQVRSLTDPKHFLKVQVLMCAACRKKWKGKWRYFHRPPFVPSD